VRPIKKEREKLKIVNCELCKLRVQIAKF